MLLIYTQKVTPRILYTFKHICTHLLGIPIKFTSKIEEFIAHDGPKMSYGKQPMGNEFFIQKVDLLMEQGFSDFEIKVLPWEDTVCFFAVQDASELPFDIFAASFYLLSRYEEYLPHVKDSAGRFPPAESLAAQESFLHQPVVDIWALKFRDILLERFPDLEWKERQFNPNSIISVEHTFIFRNKGFLRSFIGLHKDLLKLDFQKVIDRIQVWLRVKEDPHAVFDDLTRFIKEHRLGMLFMFQLSDFSVHDRNISYNRITHRAVIKSVADYARVGLLMGYYAMDEIKTLRREKLRMEEIVHSPLEHAMNSRFNLQLPDYYKNLTELEINHDYSMGYPDMAGFRAGTCNPYLFYDINMEVTTPLKLHPYAFHSSVADLVPKGKLREDLTRMLAEVREVGGDFYAVFKNQDFSEYAESKFYYSLLNQVYGLE